MCILLCSLTLPDVCTSSFLEEDLKFGERPFDDVHVLTGTLKLYFRELPEPLFPFDSYSGVVDSLSKYFLKIYKSLGIRNGSTVSSYYCIRFSVHVTRSCGGICAFD